MDQPRRTAEWAYRVCRLARQMERLWPLSMTVMLIAILVIAAFK